MPQTNSTPRVQKTRAKQKERRQHIKDLVANDVVITVEPTPWNTIKITYDMAPETHAALEAWCAERRHSLDDFLQDVNTEALAKTVYDAKRRKNGK